MDRGKESGGLLSMELQRVDMTAGLTLFIFFQIISSRIIFKVHKMSVFLPEKKECNSLR